MMNTQETQVLNLQNLQPVVGLEDSKWSFICINNHNNNSGYHKKGKGKGTHKR